MTKFSGMYSYLLNGLNVIISDKSADPAKLTRNYITAFSEGAVM